MKTSRGGILFETLKLLVLFVPIFQSNFFPIHDDFMLETINRTKINDGPIIPSPDFPANGGETSDRQQLVERRGLRQKNI